MRTSTPKSGRLLDEFPFVCLGEKKRTLIIFPWITDALEDLSINPSRVGWLCRSLADGYTVYIIGRKRRLPAGYTTRDAAADYARVFESVIGPANIMGISMGGLIAQHFAIDFPQYVQSLVIGCSAYCVGEKHLVQYWETLARENRWRKLYLNMATVSFSGFSGYFFGGMQLFAKKPDSLSDFIVSANACLQHDTFNRLNVIGARTLVIGGLLDRLFPEPLFTETARHIPNAALRLMKGVGHAAFIQRKDEFNNAVKSFLSHEQK